MIHFPSRPQAASEYGFLIVVAVALLFLPPISKGQTTVFEELFNDRDQFSVSQGAMGQDGSDNYFILAQNASPSIGKSYSGADGNFLAGQDTDDPDIGGGGAAPVQVEWTGIDISGEAGLEFTGSFGEVLDGSGDIDDDDVLRIEYRIDGGAWRNLIAFQNDGTSSNTTFKEDTDFDGNGEGTEISSSDGSLVSFTKSISGTGSTLDLRFTAHVDSGDEDFAVDNFKVESSPAVQFTASSGTVSEDEGSTALSVKILNPPGGTSVTADVVFSSGSSSASSSDVNSFGTKNVSFPSDAGDGDVQSVTVSLSSDGAAEGSETAVFDLQNVSGGSATAGSPNQFDLTIQDAVSDHSGDVLITEIMPDPDAVSDGDGEYVELYNATSSDIDVGSWTIDGGGETDNLSGVTIPARGFAVLCVNSDGSENGGIQNCDLDYVNGISLNNGGETITLTDGNGNQVDAVTYADTDPWPDPTGASLLFTGTSGNGEGSNWTAATERERGFAINQSGDNGSPGRSGNQQALQPSTEVTGSAGWRLLSAPMSNVTPNALARANLVQGISGHFPGFDTNLYQWPGGTTNNVDWTPPASATTDLTSGARGFIWYVFGTAETAGTDPPPFILGLPGSPRTATVDATGLGDGFYLLGNPYAQAYDLSDLDLSGKGFSTTVQVWDPSAGSFQNVTQSSDATDHIGPYQGFFVERASGTAEKTLTFSPGGRRADPTPLKNTSPTPTRIAFQLTGAAADTVLTRDEALTLLAHPKATLGGDVYDASKLTPLSGRYATAAFESPKEGSTALRAVASIPSPLPQERIELPIRLTTSNAGAVDRFRLAWSARTNLPDAWTLALHDAKTDSTVNLRRRSGYTFELDTPTKYRAQSNRRATTQNPRTPTPLPRTVSAKAGAGSSRFVLRIESSQIPVEFTGLEASVSGSAVTLRWTTASETNNAGFAVEHRDPAAQHFESLGFVEGAGTTNRSQHYRYRTRPLEAGHHTFRLWQVDVGGTGTYSDTVSVRVRLDRAVQVTVAPMPVHERATATLRVQTEQDVTVSLYDALGRRVRILHRGRLEPRRPHTFQVKAQGLASGVYFLRAAGERFRETRRITVVR